MGTDDSRFTFIVIYFQIFFCRSMVFEIVHEFEKKKYVRGDVFLCLPGLQFCTNFDFIFENGGGLFLYS